METLAPAKFLIRRAESQDVDQIIDLCWNNAADGPFKRKIKFNRHTLRMFVGALLADEKARVLVHEHKGIDGVFAFTTFPNFYYFAGAVIASMVVWSVARNARGRVSLALKDEGERAALELGAKYMVMNGPSEDFVSLCEHCGYSLLEYSCIKELT